MEFGGITGGFSTPINTMGIGDPVPFSAGGVGSGDLFGQPVKKTKKTPFKVATKKAATGFEQLPLIVMSEK